MSNNTETVKYVSLHWPSQLNEIPAFLEKAAALALTDADITTTLFLGWPLLRGCDDASFGAMLDAIKSVKFTDIDIEALVATDPEESLRLDQFCEAIGSISSIDTITYYFYGRYPFYSAVFRSLKQLRKAVLKGSVRMGGRRELDVSDEYNINEITASLRGHPSLEIIHFGAPLQLYPPILPLLRTVPLLEKLCLACYEDDVVVTPEIAQTIAHSLRIHRPWRVQLYRLHFNSEASQQSVFDALVQLVWSISMLNLVVSSMRYHF